MRFGSIHLRFIASAAAAVILVPVVGQWFIEYAEELGLYEHPVERTRTVISALVGAAWFNWLGGGVLGIAAGVWLDAMVRRSEVTLQASGAELPIALVTDDIGRSVNLESDS